MKSINITVGVILVVILIVYFFFWRGEHITNMPPKNDTVVFFGDSFVAGVGATEDNDLPRLIDRAIDQMVLNHGKSGDTTHDALARVDAAIAQDPGMVVIVLGGNDVLQKIPKNETFDNMKTMIDLFHDSGAVVVLVGVRSGVVGDGRGDEYEELAHKTGSVYVSDILSDVFGKRQYMTDAVHPNDAGYAMIAERLIPIISDLYMRE